MRVALVVVMAAALITLASIASGNKTQFTQTTVVSINRGNIILLLALKVVVVVVVFGLSGLSYGRSLSASSERTWVNHEDLMFLTAFALSNDLQGHGCVSRVACLHPTLARQLASAAAFLSPLEGSWLEIWKAKYHLEEGFHTRPLTSESCRQHHTCPQLPDL